MRCVICGRLHYTADTQNNRICAYCRSDGTWNTKAAPRCPQCGKPYMSWEYLGDGFYDHECDDDDEE